MKTTWREHAAPIIDRVLDENAGKPLKEINAALRAAYPFGAREYFPCKVWCSEVRKQLVSRRLLVVEKEMPLFESTSSTNEAG